MATRNSVIGGRVAAPQGEVASAPLAKSDDVGSRPFKKRLSLNWQAGATLVLAATTTSMLLKSRGVEDCRCSHMEYLIHSLVYSSSICVLLLYTASHSWAYISRRRFPLNWILLFFSILLPAIAGTFLSGLILVAAGQHSSSDYTKITTHTLEISLILSMIFGVSFYLYEKLSRELEATTLQLHAKALEEERARKLAIAAQLSSLESRVRPHFLFNTLNSISSLIQENPERAERMVEHLSALLRFSLDANQRRMTPLRDEIRLVRDYLEIEQTRFNSRLRFTLDASEALDNAPVPPFAVQTLVENSVKYAVAPRREGGEIRVAARVEGQHLRLEVRDDGPGFSPDAIVSGRGLDTLQARLAALYGARASLEIGAGDEPSRGATVTLLIPFVP
jgi:sensor histidine kinase YesM